MRTLTAAELALLKSLAQVEVVTFMPEGAGRAAVARYEATLASLKDMQKAGWVELQIADEKTRQRGQTRQGASARCTEAGREALRLLGEQVS
ncbi:MAG TPA: hypothetical protein VHR41_19380 [Gemmatimonadales bacterium]|nr:hypothetical protein [Gemmatimonadales bacterium]